MQLRTQGIYGCLLGSLVFDEARFMEMYWAWVRRRLRAKDLEELNQGLPPITRQGFKLRVRALVASPRGVEVAQEGTCFFRLG